MAFFQWEKVPTHQHQVVATQELGATWHLEAILVPHSQGDLHPILKFLQAKDMEPDPVERAYLVFHRHLHRFIMVVQPRSHYLVAFLEDRCLLSILEDKLFTLVSLQQ